MKILESLDLASWNLKPYFSSLLITLAFIWILWNRLPVWWNHWQMEGQTLAPSTVKDVDGQPVPFPPATHKKQVLVFWASWCGPCKIELRRFNQALLAGELPPNSVQTVAVWDDEANVKSYMAKEGFIFPVFFTQDLELLQKYQVHATPTILHIDEEQKVKWATSGISPTGILRAKNFLNTPSGDSKE